MKLCCRVKTEHMDLIVTWGAREMRLEGRVALVTGAASGIGKAVVERFCAEGAKVVANDVNPDGRQLCESWRALGYTVQFYQQDVGDLTKLSTMVDSCVETFGRLDILVNNAAIAFPRSVFQMTQSDWYKLLRVNLDAIFFLSQAAARVMKVQNYGRIVNISSLQGYRGAADTAHYNAAKGGVIQLTRCFAVELAEFGILVNSIAPGTIHTAMSITDGIDEVETEQFRDVYVKYGKIPLRRAGEPVEVASSVLFFASDDCPYVTGQVLGVDGGLSVVW